ncbi:MAG: multidrug efflux RND transporter permease subunit [Parvibaculaceae bacterium]|nr:multidrug efflux RND transporter permease subunit [Parvibaculaceae bacterium]
MSVSGPFIERPIATSLLAIAILLAGLLGYRGLAISSLPQVDFPTIQVTTQLPGASPDTMASLVTASLERQFGQISSLETMTSSSSFGISRITLQFTLDRNIDDAAQDVQAAINAANSTLPANLPYPPTYSKVNPADTAVVTIALTSDTLSLTKMSDFADTLLAQKLAQVSGVGHVSVEGGLKPAVRIQADIARLAGYGLGLDSIRTAIAAANVAGAKGTLNGTSQSYTIAANDQLEDADAYRNLIVAYVNSAPVHLSDVATVVDDLENNRTAGWYQGKPAVVLDIQRQPGANIVETVAGIKQALPALESTLPKGVDLVVVNDRTATINASVADVQFTLVLSVALVVMVVLLFLRTFRATLIVGVALPLSLIATFAVMWLSSFSLDNLSLMALTIGTGFVVDDAIVMIENIVRHIENGEKPLDAARKGAREIGFTVISLTMSLIAVFIPLLFMSGIVGRLFQEFALTLTIAVVTSAIVSLTLTPMMASRLLQPAEAEKHGRIIVEFDRFFAWMQGGYARSLGWVLRHERMTLLVAGLTLVLTILMYIWIPKGFLPQQDTGLITIITEGGQDVSFSEMSRLQQQVAAIVQKDPDVAGVVSLVGVSTTNLTPNSGHLAVTLKPQSERGSSANEIIDRLRPAVAAVAGLSAYYQPVQDVQISTQVSRTQYQYTLIDSDAADLSTWTRKLLTGLQQSTILRHVTSDLQDNGLEIMVNVDREKAGRLGVTMQNVNDALYDAFGQRQISTIYTQANQYRVVLEAQARYLIGMDALSILHVPSSGGDQVPLGAIATFTRGTTPLVITHLAQFPAVTISFDLAKGASLSEAIEEIARIEQDLGKPSTVAGAYSGDAAEFSASLSHEPLLILAAVIVIYIVLGVLYESAIHPLTILSTLPSAGVGALLALVVCGLDLSLVALIGIILLMGIVKKNAIMMIDFAIEARREEGLDARAAIIKACNLRFRPIMMTTLAALLGALPLAFAHGTGAELRVPLGVTIVGGLLVSQALTLYTTPVIYLGMESLIARFHARKGRRASQTGPR